MKHIEIDHIEVTDHEIDVTYWVTGSIEGQRLKFLTKDYDQWLLKNKKTLPSVYWDKWSSLMDEKQIGVFQEDMKHYLMFRTNAFKPTSNAALNLERKPMSKVAKPRSLNSGAETA